MVTNNIKPFNDFFFKSCFYNSLLSIMTSHSMRKTEQLISHFLPMYEMDDTSDVCKLGVEYSLVYLSQDEYNNLGLCVVDELLESNIVESIKEKIDKGISPIIYVDCYYLPHCSDYYKKKSREHVLTVCGYDNQNCVFKIIDQAKFDTLTYREMIIGYDDLEKAITNYVGEFPRSKIYKSNVFSVTACSEGKIIMKEIDFDIRLKEHIKEYQQGINAIERFLLKLYEIMKNDKSSELLNDEIINGLNDIINAKKAVEIVYKNRRDSKQEYLANIIAKWSEIRSSLLYCMIRSQLNERKIAKIPILINEIIELEKEYVCEIGEVKV